MVVVVLGQLARSPKADDIRHRECSGATSLFLGAADYKWSKRDLVSHVERADSLWRVQFVTRKREQIDLNVFQVDLDLPHSLNTIDMKRRLGAFADDAPDLFYRKQNTRFIVSKHY